MKKFLIIFILILVAVTSIFYIIKPTTLIVGKDIYGMRITIISGSTNPNHGSRTNLSYLIRTNSDKLIVVDGGDEYIDYLDLYNYINKYGNGTVNYWFITHAHADHVGALCKLLNEDYDIKIENLCYFFNDLKWYEQYDNRGYEYEKLIIESLDNPKIQNKIECYKNQIIDIDHIKCEILRVADPNITMSDNGNDSSMCFKFSDEYSNKSMLFLGDSYTYTSEELLKDSSKLNSFAVQMAHHGQNGVTKEVYDAISPKLCFFSTPQWLYDNNCGTGYNSGGWKTVIVREWIKEYNSDIVASFNGDQYFRFTKTGYEVLDENDNVLYEVEK